MVFSENSLTHLSCSISQTEKNKTTEDVFSTQSKKKNLRTAEDLSKPPLLNQVNLHLPLEVVQFWLSYGCILRLIDIAQCFLKLVLKRVLCSIL